MPQSDAGAVKRFLADAARRARQRVAAQGAAAGWAIALVLAIAGWPARGSLMPLLFVGTTLAIVGSVVHLRTTRGERSRIARLIERRAPECRNLVVTADELLRRPPRNDLPVSAYVAALVYRDAARAIGRLHLPTLFPIRNTLLILGLSAGLWAVAVARPALPGLATAAMGRTGGAAATVDAIDVTVVPPSYTGRPTQKMHDPARIMAFAGSRLQLVVHARAIALTMETLHGRQTLSATSPGTFSIDLPADADGYVALEPQTAEGRPGPRRLIGLSVTMDQPPRVRVTAPGRDLRLADSHGAIDLAVEADDDLGLASLKVRYTRVSGSGERFTFVEGEVPLAVDRKDERNWKARATWRLDSLHLEPGDMLVYRAVAADRRPGAPTVESDSWIAEIVEPGGVAAAGFAIDPEQDRYALSEQMVILKTQRLLQRHPSLSTDDYASEAAELASEQRRVRAEFVFMMGGEVGDDQGEEISMTDLNETAEANGEGELAAGRMLNRGRAALLASIRLMSRAAAALTTADLAAALVQERGALVQLEQAFSHSRIILRALSERERLDLSRRLTGVLADAARETHAAIETPPDPRVSALRRALAEIATLAGSGPFTGDAPGRTTALAAEVLRADPSAPSLQRVATLLGDAATAMVGNQPVESRARLDDAAVALAAVLRASLFHAPPPAPSSEAAQLDGALVDALQHRSGGP